MAAKTKTHSLRELMLGILFLFGLIAVGFGGLVAYHRITHWPKLEHPEAIVAYADREFAKGLPDREILAEDWPEEIRRLAPRYVFVDARCLDIIVHTGGALRGNTGFYVLRSAQQIPTEMARDVIQRTGTERIVKYDLAY